MVRLIACKPLSRYNLWLKYSDGSSGVVSLESVLDLGMFRALRDQHMFRTARVDEETGAVRWPQAGVRLDPEILRQDILARGAILHEPPSKDLAFARFMAAVLEPGRRRRK